MTTVKIEGLDELKQAFNDLPREFHRVALRPGVMAAAQVVQKAAKASAPKDTGVLVRSIYRTRDKANSNQVQEAAMVGVRSGKRYKKKKQDAYYWRFVEFGTKFLPARPFLRPAAESTKSQQLAAMVEKLKVGMEKAVAKARSKYK